LKDEVGKIQQLEKTVEAMQKDMVKMRQDFKKAIAETIVEKLRLEVISVLRKEMCSLGQTLPTRARSHEAGKKKSYNDAVVRKKESIIIVKREK